MSPVMVSTNSDERPEHREHEPAVAERLAAVQPVEERLVGVRLGPEQRAGPGVDDELAILAAGRLAGEDRHRRLVDP